jgi:carbon storage regulator
LSEHGSIALDPHAPIVGFITHCATNPHPRAKPTGWGPKPEVRGLRVTPERSKTWPGWKASDAGPMLTLTRKIGQKILIGNGIEVVVREVRGRQVRLGITAPDGLPVFREELWEDLAASNLRAQSTLDRARADELPEPIS